MRLAEPIPRRRGALELFGDRRANGEYRFARLGRVTPKTQEFSSTGVGFHQGQILRLLAADHLAEPFVAVGPGYLHGLGVAYYMAVSQQQAVGGDQEAAAPSLAGEDLDRQRYRVADRPLSGASGPVQRDWLLLGRPEPILRPGARRL